MSVISRCYVQVGAKIVFFSFKNKSQQNGGITAMFCYQSAVLAYIVNHRLTYSYYALNSFFELRTAKTEISLSASPSLEYRKSNREVDNQNLDFRVSR